MRRLRFGLVLLVALAVLCGGCVAWWWYVAARIKTDVVAFRNEQGARNIDVSWRNLNISGFPLGWHVALEDALLRDRRRSPAPELHVARLLASARPWRPTIWRFAAPDGLRADFAATGGKPAINVRAQRAEGAAMPAPRGGVSLWLNLRNVAAEVAGGALPVNSADAWLSLPVVPPKTDTDPDFGLALDLRQMRVSEPPVGFGHMLDELALGVTVKGKLPEGPVAPALAAWRDAGGTIEVDHLHLEWGGFGITANGTVALDGSLQPIAAFSGGFEGFDAVINALVAADWMTEEQAAIVQIALNTLAKPGPDGKPQIVAPFTIQNSRIYVGPARLGRIPHLVWQ
jgi:hypothetical protein